MSHRTPLTARLDAGLSPFPSCLEGIPNRHARGPVAVEIEIAELMVIANNFAAGYAEALILGTPKDQLVNPAVPKRKAGLSAEAVARMEQEMESLESDLKAVEGAYAENMMNLTLARGFIKKLMDNSKIVRFLSANHADILTEFEAIASAETM